MPKKPIFSKCGHSFCKKCIISKLICPTCSTKLSKTDLTENPKLKSYTKNKTFEETSSKISIYPSNIVNNIYNSNYNYDNSKEPDENNKNTNKNTNSYRNNNPNNISQLTKEILKCNNNKNNNYLTNNYHNEKNNFEMKSNNLKNINFISETAIMHENNNSDNNENFREINNRFINVNELSTKYNNMNLNNNHNNHSVSAKQPNLNLLKNNNIRKGDKNNYSNKGKNTDIDEDVNNFYKTTTNIANNEYLISLKDLYIGKKRIHKEFVKGQNNLIEQKNFKKYAMNLNINCLNKYSEETDDFFFENFVNMFNPNDDYYEKNCVIPESDLLGSVRKSKKK